jgi:hypothetical protein
MSGKELIKLRSHFMVCRKGFNARSLVKFREIGRVIGSDTGKGRKTMKPHSGQVNYS